jgi:hypothetical protein
MRQNLKPRPKGRYGNEKNQSTRTDNMPVEQRRRNIEATDLLIALRPAKAREYWISLNRSRLDRRA